MAPPNTGPGYMGYAKVPILPRPEVAYMEIFMPLDLPNVDILDKRYCKVLSSQEAVQTIFKVTQKFKELCLISIGILKISLSTLRRQKIFQISFLKKIVRFHV